MAPESQQSTHLTPWAQTSRDLERRSARSIARDLSIAALSRWQILRGGFGKFLSVPRVQFLLLHHAFPDEELRFRRTLKSLSRTHRLIPYGEAVRRAESGQGSDGVDRPYLAFSFDDGFKNGLRAAAILEEFGARACFFVCPFIVGERDMRRVELFCRERLELIKPVQFMDWDDLAALRDRGHEIGGHTVTHARLTSLPPEQLANEIGGSFNVLNERLGKVKHFAWTYGRFSDCSPEAVKAAFAVGYRSVASGERGCHGPQRINPSAPLCIRRDQIVARWPLHRVKYFLARSCQRLSPMSGDFPPWFGPVRPGSNGA